nr:hypothetical protein JVH1_1153 [Rhodococcus sp. JVH1]
MPMLSGTVRARLMLCETIRIVATISAAVRKIGRELVGSRAGASSLQILVRWRAGIQRGRRPGDPGWTGSAGRCCIDTCPHSRAETKVSVAR